MFILATDGPAATSTDPSKNKKGEIEQKGKGGIFNFWLLPDGATNKGFIVDLGVAKPLNLVQLVNTHTANWRDRSTKKFKVYVR